MAKSGAENLLAAELAEAAFDLWQEQWRLLAEDAEAQRDIQAMLDRLGRNLGLRQGGMNDREQAAHGGAGDAEQAEKTGAAKARPPKGRAAAAAAASDAGGADVAQLADALAELAERIGRIERRLEQNPQPGRRARPR